MSRRGLRLARTYPEAHHSSSEDDDSGLTMPDDLIEDQLLQGQDER